MSRMTLECQLPPTIIGIACMILYTVAPASPNNAIFYASTKIYAVSLLGKSSVFLMAESQLSISNAQHTAKMEEKLEPSTGGPHSVRSELVRRKPVAL